MKKRILSFVLALVTCLSIMIPIGAATTAQAAVPSITPEYRDHLLSLGFPESYIPMLAKLHEEHPNWTFTPLKITDLKSTYTWDYVISQMMANRARNLVTSSSWAPSPFTSLGHANYDPYREKSLGNGYDSGWYAANQKAIKYFMDPRNFLNDTDCFMFLDWHYEGGTVTAEQVEAVLGTCAFAHKVIPDLDGHTTYAQYLVQVGTELGVDPMFLATRLRLENGSGTSPMVNGTTGDCLGVPKYNGYYNFYNINAGGTGTTQIYTNGMEKAMTGTPAMASKWGGSGAWNTRWKAIYGGAYVLKTKYVDKYKNTLYLQKFNTDPRATGNFSGYMQNIAAPLLEGRSFRKSVVESDMLNSAYNFQIPVYTGMPNSPCADPGNGSVYYSYTKTPETSYQLALPAYYNAFEMSATEAVLVKEKAATATFTVQSGYADEITLRGWSVSTVGTRSFYYTIDGGSTQYPLAAETRKDVFDGGFMDYSSYCDSTNIGYNGSLDTSLLDAGEHTVRIYAVNNSGGSYLSATVSVVIEAPPSSANVYHEFDFTQYSTDAMVDYAIVPTHNSAVSPDSTTAGYITLKATGDDPYLTIGGLSADDPLSNYTSNYLDHVLIKYQTVTSGTGALFVNRTDGPYWGQDGTTVSFNYESCDIDGDGTADIWRHVLVDASRVWGNSVGTHLYNFRLDFLSDDAAVGDTMNVSYIKFYANAADANMCITEDSTTTVVDTSESVVVATTPIVQIGGTTYTASTVMPLTPIASGTTNSKSYGSGLQICCDKVYTIAEAFTTNFTYESTAEQTTNSYLQSVMGNTFKSNYRYISHLGFYGWVNPDSLGSGVTVTDAGYQIDDGEPVWGATLSDDGIKAVHPQASRYDIQVDVYNTTPGVHNVYLLVKLSNGSIYCLNDTWTGNHTTPVRFEHGTLGVDYGTYVDQNGVQYTVDASKNLLALGGADTGLDVYTNASVVANATVGTGVYAVSALTQVTKQADGSYAIGTGGLLTITHAKAPTAPPEASCEHNYVSATVAPTCAKNGSTYNECTKCGHKTAKKSIPALGHTMSYTAGVAATCTTAGTLSYYTCSVCKLKFADEKGKTQLTSIIAPATGHVSGAPVRENEIPATNTVDGSYDSVVYCTVCSAQISRTTVVIPAKGLDAFETVALTGTPVTNWRYAGQILTINGVECTDAVGYRDNATKTIHPATMDASSMTLSSITLSGWAMANAGQSKIVWSVDGTTWYECRTVTYANASASQKDTAVSKATLKTASVTKGSFSNLVIDLSPISGKTVDLKLAVIPSGSANSICHFVTLTGLQVGTHVHSYGSWVTTATPSCTMAGSQTRTCSCGASEVQSIAATGHTLVTVGATAATCTTAGTTEGKKCSVCQTWTVPQATIPALGHNEVAVSGYPATCTTVGMTQGRRCSVCGEITVAQTIIPATGHTEIIVPGTEATCTTAGKTQGKRCSTCGEITVIQSIIPVKDHTIVTIPGAAATCNESGLTEGEKCSVCQTVTVFQQIIPALGHTDSNRDNLCDRCHQSLVTTCVHDYVTTTTDATCTANGQTVKTCTKCGDTQTTVIVAKGHRFDRWTTTSDATCTVPGTQKRTCSSCGTTESQTIPATGHNPVTIPSRAATCNESGLTEGKKCSVCQTVTVSQQITPALGHIDSNRDNLCDRCNKPLVTTCVHDYVTTTTDATCTANGQTVKTCTKCGDTQTTVIAAKGHTIVTMAGVEATCTTAGKTEGKKCSACGEIAVAQAIIPPKGHMPGAWSIVNEPTCTEDGLKRVTCTICREEMETETIPALAHTASNWKTLEHATCSLAGVKIKTCMTCGKEMDRATVPATEEHELAWMTTKEATCTEKGARAKICRICQAVLSTEETPADGHVEKAVRGTRPTCTESGLSDGAVCATCDAVLVEQTVVAAKGHTESAWIVDRLADVGVDGARHTVCSICGVVVSTEAIPALKATETTSQVTVESVESTPTEAEESTTEAATADDEGCSGVITSVWLTLTVLGAAGVCLVRRKKNDSY